MSARPRLVIADDSHDIRDLVRTRLGAAGYEVHTAKTGVEAVSRVLTVTPHAMLLDINMPVMDGFGVLEELKTRRKVLPILMLSARHAEDDVRRAVALGAKDYLSKPFTEGQLLARVARLLRAPRSIDA